MFHVTMSTHERTTIRVLRETRGKLKALDRKEENCNDIVLKPINEINREEIIRRQYERLKEKDKFVLIEDI